MLQPEVPGFDKTPHSNLSFHMLMKGLLSKLLVETPAAKLDRELANKIMFAQFLVAMSFNYTHKQVLDTCQEMIMAWLKDKQKHVQTYILASELISRNTK